MPIVSCLRHMDDQVPGSSLIDLISGAWVLITAPVERIPATAASTIGDSISLGGRSAP